MKISLLVGFIFFTQVFAFAQNEEAISIEYDSATLHGTLLNAAGGSSIAILIIPGSGPTDRDGNSPLFQGKNNSLKYLAEFMGEEGISSLRIDKRGIAQSQTGAKEEDMSFEDYINDAAEWVKFLKTEKNFEKVLIAGHSEGSLVGMIAVQRCEADGFISLAGGGFPLDEVIAKQLEAQPPMVLEPSLAIMAKLKAGEMEEEVPQFLFSLFRPSVQPYLITLFKYDPAVEIAKLDMPVLIVQGGMDVQVDDPNGEVLKNALPSADYLYAPKMNHVLKTVEEKVLAKQLPVYGDPALPLDDDLKAGLKAFFGKIK
ncbi:alpha/beta hydrolase [Fulvivirgaceae bacterium LMO-SS25]